ncbi:hypothetical protein [Paracoccus sp. IB05]|uniref:hypothetical protein n=1 Tax=Paracoccus sp. IB05 TaxID=2779367 RepID=UPI0018E86F11|nr:hypothetical protein [Paracoccus sp. IB05]MBJ2150560.1 hypothetical protein [Paracoccus sp. IB05]
MTICLDHKRPLVALWTTQDRLDRHDVAERLADLDLSAIARPQARDPSGFELWFQGRLEGKSEPGQWLDQFDLHAAAQFCFELGRAAIATKLRRSTAIREDLHWWPAAIGFRLCAGGDADLCAALVGLQHLMGHSGEGPRKIFGGLYDVLARDPCPEEMRPFRSILQRHILETWPLAPGDEVLGEPVLHPGRMGVRAVAHLLQIPETEVIAAIGEDRSCPPEWRLIGRAEAKALFPQSLAEPEFCKALSLSTRQFKQMRDEGLLQPVEGGFWDVWAAQDLIDDLLHGAEPISFVLHDWCSLTEASDRLQMTFPEIIDDIRSGRIARVGKYLQRSGFASILINLGHLEQEGEAISIETFAFSLGLRPGELMTFVRRDSVSCQQLRGARGNAQVRMSAADRQAFHERFISFRALGGAAGLGWGGASGLA